jgi:ribosomal protein S18 acetylase RimI-like enzyme
VKCHQKGDPSFKSLRKKVIERAEELEKQEKEYWIIGNVSPILITSSLIEPSYMLEPAGTRLGRLFLAHDDLAEDRIHRAISTVKELASKVDMRYIVYHSDSGKDNSCLAVLYEEGFEIVDRYLLMRAELNEKYPEDTRLEFVLANSEEKRKILLHLQYKYYQGSEDERAVRIMEHMMGVPSETLDRWYDMKASYLVMNGNHTIGIVAVSVDGQTLNSIAVAPDHRGKGFGREMANYALNRMIELGCRECGLRVHQDNKEAVNLYKSLGFEIQQKGIMAALWFE